jgi:hypothetical protein
MTTEETNVIVNRRPTYDDLKRRAEEAGFGGGRGVMDSREWYELCYFEPLEDYLFKALKNYRPWMTDEDVAVCVSTWIYDNSVSRATYEHITDRLLFVDEEGYSRRDAILQAAYKAGYVFAYSIYRYGEEVKNNGQGSGPFLASSDDIDYFLDELVWRECIENDAEIIATQGKEAFEELTEILHKSQERDDRRYSK